MQDLIDAIRRILVGHTDEEKEKIKDDFKEIEGDREKKKKAAEENENDLPSQMKSNWLPLALTGILLFFVIRD